MCLKRGAGFVKARPTSGIGALNGASVPLHYTPSHATHRVAAAATQALLALGLEPNIDAAPVLLQHADVQDHARKASAQLALAAPRLWARMRTQKGYSVDDADRLLVA